MLLCYIPITNPSCLLIYNVIFTKWLYMNKYSK